MAIPLGFLMERISCAGCKEIGCGTCAIGPTCTSILVGLFGLVLIIVSLVQKARLRIEKKEIKKDNYAITFSIVCIIFLSLCIAPLLSLMRTIIDEGNTGALIFVGCCALGIVLMALNIKRIKKKNK